MIIAGAAVWVAAAATTMTTLKTCCRSALENGKVSRLREGLRLLKEVWLLQKPLDIVTNILEDKYSKGVINI